MTGADPPDRRSRRAVLGAAAGVLAALAARPAAAQQARAMRLYNLRTGERFDDAYHDGVDYAPAALEALDWLLRDHRENIAVAIDPALYDLLWRLSERYLRARGHRVTINILSGFRTAATNELLRSEGAAENSLHLQGMAADVSVQGYGVQILANQAQHVASGGLGIYWSRQFVHFDTGRPRLWHQR